MKCRRCMHKSNEGFVNTCCVKCKHMYDPSTEEYKEYSDLYEETAITSVKTIEQCCEMIKLQGKLISERLNDDEQFYIRTLNQIADRILALNENEGPSNEQNEVSQGFDAKKILETFFNVKIEQK